MITTKQKRDTIPIENMKLLLEILFTTRSESVRIGKEDWMLGYCDALFDVANEISKEKFING
ncbi:MAG: hypothetical protein WC476_00900 [Phycisphaerae bacterium]